MNKKILLLLPALAMVLAGCNGKKQDSSTPTSSSSADAVTAVDVAPAEKTLEAGETVQLEATVKPFSVSNKDVTWSSDNEALATVNASGLVTTLEAGTVHIKATSQADTSKSGQSTLTITPAYVYYPEKTPDTTKTYKFGTYQKALSQRIFFNGEFEDYPRGKTAEGYENGVDVQFEDGPDAGKYYVKFTVGGATKYFGMGNNHRFGGFDSKSEETVWDWNSELKTIARTLSDSKTYFPGTYNNYTTISGCDITMASSDYIFQFLTKLEPVDPTSVSIVEDTANIYAGTSLQLHAECAPAGAMNAKLTWSVVEDNDKVHVDNHGLVSIDADATPNTHVTIKATWGDLPGDTCDVTIKEKLNYGTVESPLNVAEAKELIDKFPAGTKAEEKLTVKGYVSAEHGAFTKTTNAEVWFTNDDGTEQKAFECFQLISTDEIGDVAANALVGKQVTVTGWALNYSGTYEFTNKDPNDSYDRCTVMKIEDGARVPTDLAFNTAAFELEQGGSKAVSATLLPYGASGNIQWAVSPADQGVTYENGEVKATAGALAGDYTLTASVQGTEVSKNLSFKVVAPLVSVGKFTFTNTKNSTAVDDSATICGWFTRVSGTLNVTAASNCSKVYAGANGGSGDNAWEVGNSLKIGSSSAGGTLTLTVSSAVKKVVLTGYGWKNTIVVTINTVTSDELKNNLANKTNVEAGNVGTAEFVFASASTSIAISTNVTSVLLTGIEFYA